jgi:hypothetical protein
MIPEDFGQIVDKILRDHEIRGLLPVLLGLVRLNGLVIQHSDDSAKRRSPNDARGLRPA